MIAQLFKRLTPSLSKFCQMKLNSFLFRWLPFQISRHYLASMGKLYYVINWQEKRVIRRTIRYLFQEKLAPYRIKRLIKAAFRGIFDHYHEKLYVAYSWFPGLVRFLKAKVRLVGAEGLDEALAAGRGVILVTGHYGAVEFLPGTLALNGYPATMICRFTTNRLRLSLQKRAGRVGLQLIDADDGNVFLAALKALKQGRILITECDEFDEWRQDTRQTVRFLGERLRADRTLEILTKRSGSPVVSALVQRNGRAAYHLNFTPITAPPEQAGRECLAVLEQAVKANPEQWYQWKKFGKMIEARLEVEDAREESGYLAPEFGFSLPDQA